MYFINFTQGEVGKYIYEGHSLYKAPSTVEKGKKSQVIHPFREGGVTGIFWGSFLACLYGSTESHGCHSDVGVSISVTL